MDKTGKRYLVEMSDGAYLHVERYAGPGSPVVFIPGFCCTTAFFERNVSVVAREHEVFAYDPRGQGRSSKGLQGHTVARNARDLHELIEWFGLHQVCLVAWSMAGQFAMDYVRQFKTERLGSLVLADCPLHALGDEPWNAHGLRGFDVDRLNEHLVRGYGDWEGYCRGFAQMIWDDVDPGRVEWATREFLKTPPWIAFAAYADMVFQNGYPYLAQADVPMLFCGADSRVTSNGKDLARRWYPQSRPEGLVSRTCTFDQGGHVFFHAECDKFNEALLSFLREFADPAGSRRPEGSSVCGGGSSGCLR